MVEELEGVPSEMWRRGLGTRRIPHGRISNESRGARGGEVLIRLVEKGGTEGKVRDVGENGSVGEEAGMVLADTSQWEVIGRVIFKSES